MRVGQGSTADFVNHEKVLRNVPFPALRGRVPDTDVLRTAPKAVRGGHRSGGLFWRVVLEAFLPSATCVYLTLPA